MSDSVHPICGQIRTIRNASLILSMLIVCCTENVSSFLINKSTIRNKSDLCAESEAGVRKPWEFFRFVSQSSKFVSTPFSENPNERKVEPGDLLWEPNAQTEFTFGPLDDVVMGGASSSSFDGSTGIWSGTVTDANNGGFVGIRSTPVFLWDVTRCAGLELTLRSVMKEGRLKIGLRDSKDFNGLVWNASVDVKTKSTKVRVPFDQLKATRFASITDGGTLQRRNIVGLQLVYSKFDYDGKLNPRFDLGDMKIQLTNIQAY